MPYLLAFPLLLAVLFFHPNQLVSALEKQQSVGIMGQLMCDNSPLVNTKVKLWNKNLGRDDELAAGTTDEEGRYKLSGDLNAVLPMDVYFKVYHDCYDTMLGGMVEGPCQRKAQFRIPDDYITRTANVTRWFNGGVMNMALKYESEQRSCLN